MSEQAYEAPKLNYAALGKAVVARRRFLRISRQEIQSRGGPSHMTTWSIEQGTRTDRRGVTLDGLDVALGWPVGTSGRILDDIIDGQEFIEAQVVNEPIALPATATPAVSTTVPVVPAPPPHERRRARSGGYWYVDGSSQPLGWMIREQWLIDERHEDDKPIALVSSQATAEMIVQAVNALLHTEEK